MSEVKNKRLKTILLLLINKLTKTTIVEVYVIGFSHSLAFIGKHDWNKKNNKFDRRNPKSLFKRV